MSKTIAIISFKELPGRKFKIKAAKDEQACGSRYGRLNCTFYKQGCPRGSEICHATERGVYFKEIKK